MYDAEAKRRTLTDFLRKPDREAVLSWQRDRSWCQTGVAIRKRKNSEVKVHNPDTEAKKVLIE